MTTQSIPTPAPQAHTVANLAISYFEAVLTRDSQTLRDTFGYSKQECEAIEPEQQQHAASKLMAAGNVLTRKTPQLPLAGKEKTQPSAEVVTPLKRPVFCPNPSAKNPTVMMG
ncbi:TPA: hypothetical protein QHW38_003590 [Escherichia coli]|nr:hypothetical protein [Escherichia coli]HDS7611728.1 hypothetical protein [Escherichia coli]